MKKSSISTSKKKKALVTSAAAVSLGVLATRPKAAKAATQPANQAAVKKINTKKKAVKQAAPATPAEPITTENEAVQSYAVTTEVNVASDTAQNQDASSNSESSNSASNATTVPDNNSAVKVEQRDDAPTNGTVSGQVNGLNLSYNLDTDELIIEGGSCEEYNTSFGSLVWWMIPSGDANYALSSTKKISITAPTKLNVTSQFFSNFSELTEITGLNLLDTSAATDMSYMFANCPKLTSLDLSTLNTANVTNMSYMFSDCSSLKNLNLANCNTANVTDMSYMFSDCSSLTDLDLANFSTSKVSKMSNMFSGCRSLINLNLASFNTSNVEDMAAMFQYCSELTSLNLENFITPKVEFSFDMFQYCSKLRKLNIKNFSRTDDFSIFGEFLRGCDNLNTLVLGPNTSAISSLTAPGLGPDCWQKVDVVNGGTTIRPKGPEYTSEELAKIYTVSAENSTPFPDDTYVRMGKSFFVHHADENGKDIPGTTDTEFPGNYGDPGQIYGDPINGYTLKANQSPQSVTYGDKSDTFDFIYIKNAVATAPVTTTPVQATDVTVHYQDENGNSLAADDILKGNVGDGYISSAKTIAGYTLKARPDNATGFFTAASQSVTYVYAQEATSGAGANAGNKSEPSHTKTKKATGHVIHHSAAPATQVSETSSVKAKDQTGTDSQRLPQTGANKQSLFANLAAGIMLLLNGTVFSWFRRQKKED